jgi:diguanylate cyclase (GGDEF)-like protein
MRSIGFHKFLRATPAADPEVMISQIKAFSRQIPLLYIIGNVNSIALAYTHYNSAPKLLTFIVPIPLLLICVIRFYTWYRARHRTFTAAQALSRLRGTVVISSALGFVYAIWAICLYPYGDAYQRCHVAFFMATTVIGTIFCLMHLRQAALLVTVVVTIPFLLRFLTTGEPVLTAMAVSYVMVMSAVVFLLCRYYKDFIDLVHSQKTLAALSDENFRIANLDSLTGLPNRRSFFSDLTKIFEQQKDDETRLVFGLIDLDGFKPVNDVFGHVAGDLVLIEVGRRLRELLGDTGLVARLGGDEFGLLLTLAPGSSDVLAKGAEICRAIERPIPLQTGFARVAASIGFAVRSDAAATWQQLIERADYALYNAKSTQRGTSVLFSAQHESAIHMKSLLEQELRRADFGSEMSMTFQPIVDVGRGKTVAFEALARWKSPALGDVSPVDFIAAAERMGLINQLTEVLFTKALAAMRTWPEDIDLSFNLSVRDLACGDSIARLQSILFTSDIAPRRICFEITESALIKDFDLTREMLLCLKAGGTRIALDDFGTGYSSLGYVHRLPLDKIKVDRSFVRDITTDMTSRDIVTSILDLCRNLMITCIVEGVETTDQVHLLEALGCTAMQGYYFGRPAGNEDILAQFVARKTDAAPSHPSRVGAAA